MCDDGDDCDVNVDANEVEHDGGCNDNDFGNVCCGCCVNYGGDGGDGVCDCDDYIDFYDVCVDNEVDACIGGVAHIVLMVVMVVQ